MAGKARLLVGVDPMSEVLVIVEANRALSDTSLIRSLVDSRTLGQVRAADPQALALVSSFYADTRDPSDEERDVPFTDLPDSMPFSVKDRFGGDYWYLLMPLARLITPETVPQEVLDGYWQPDHNYGLDYIQAPWLRLDDWDEIVARLHDAGYDVDDGPTARALLRKYAY